jgi:hypothetical protein
MIKLEYDVQTAGVRVSFVVKDGEGTLPEGISPSNWENAVKGDSSFNAPQTENNLGIVKRLLEAVPPQ